MTSHPTHNGTDEVDIEDGINVHNMEHDGNAQKAKAPESRHVEVFDKGSRRDACVL